MDYRRRSGSDLVVVVRVSLGRSSARVIRVCWVCLFRCLVSELLGYREGSGSDLAVVVRVGLGRSSARAIRVFWV